MDTVDYFKMSRRMSGVDEDTLIRRTRYTDKIEMLPMDEYDSGKRSKPETEKPGNQKINPSSSVHSFNYRQRKLKKKSSETKGL